MNRSAVVLETSRLILRPTEPQDFDAYAKFMADPQSARYLGGSQARSEAWRGFCHLGANPRGMGGEIGW